MAWAAKASMSTGRVSEHNPDMRQTCAVTHRCVQRAKPESLCDFMYGNFSIDKGLWMSDALILGKGHKRAVLLHTALNLVPVIPKIATCFHGEGLLQLEKWWQKIKNVSANTIVSVPSAQHSWWSWSSPAGSMLGGVQKLSSVLRHFLVYRNSQWMNAISFYGQRGVHNNVSWFQAPLYLWVRLGSETLFAFREFWSEPGSSLLHEVVFSSFSQSDSCTCFSFLQTGWIPNRSFFCFVRWWRGFFFVFLGLFCELLS